MFTPALLDTVRARFAHVEACPFSGPRVFFENAGGALTLKSVVETSALYAAIPDNQGRDNPASKALMAAIDKAKADMRLFFNAFSGQVFVGESGTEVLFRLVRTAALGAAPGGILLSTTLEHPASRSAMARWAEVTGRAHVLVPHEDATGCVEAAAYARYITPDVRVATLVHTSPVTGMTVDAGAIAAAIRKVSPDCFIIVDGIQHASHGAVDIAALGIDGYAISPYKVFSRHGYGVGWASDRLTACTKETVIGGPATSWEMGTRDTGSYATFSDVVTYFDWLGSHFTKSDDRRARLEAAAQAIHGHEHMLAEAMVNGTGNLRGLKDIPGLHIIGGADNARREGVVSVWLEGITSEEVVSFLNGRGIRTHTRKADHYSGNVLAPMGLKDCIRISFSHYNSPAEVGQFLTAIDEFTSAR
ncbi:aminotransferase class V-fold PLP-dependent enzyme [Aestuariivirga sp.]|uniref:aminotransferase class V-fold PLP-dependent enzyme n=1 Tax=Aestuariivirga sp. TaxID=2650926 RepID=UPI0025C08D9F|nr:aminotransferase class V-fold PLP-dependent enzyme [Aestuariivirga sp.]